MKQEFFKLALSAILQNPHMTKWILQWEEAESLPMSRAVVKAAKEIAEEAEKEMAYKVKKPE